MLATADKVGGIVALSFSFNHYGFPFASIRRRLRVRDKRENTLFDVNLSTIRVLELVGGIDIFSFQFLVGWGSSLPLVVVSHALRYTSSLIRHRRNEAEASESPIGAALMKNA